MVGQGNSRGFMRSDVSLIVLVLLDLFVAFVVGCDPDQDKEHYYGLSRMNASVSMLPPGSEHVEYLGLGWVAFEYRGLTFLFHYYDLGNMTTESLTQVQGWVTKAERP